MLARRLYDALVDVRSRRAEHFVVTAVVRDPRPRELVRRWSAPVADHFSAQLDDDVLPARTIELVLDGTLGISDSSSTAHV